MTPPARKSLVPAPIEPTPTLEVTAGGRAWSWAAVLLVLLAFFAPALGAGTFTYRDTGRLHAPMKLWIAGELARGVLPEWNPYAGLGAPVIANAIDAPQHPFGAVLVLLPSAVGFKVWILLSFLLAALGAFVLARSLGQRSHAAAVVAIAFTLSGPLVSSSDNVTYLTSYAALPWVFAAMQRFLTRGGAGAMALVAIACALCAAGGDPQAWAIATGGLPVYALVFRGAAGWRSAARRGIVAAGASLLAAAPFVLPVAEWVPHSVRAAGLDPTELIRWNLHPRRLLEFAVPGLFRGDISDPVSPLFEAYCGNEATPLPWFLSVYLGGTVLALALLGVFAERRMRWLAAGAGLVLWAALGPHAGFGQLAARLPLLGAFRFWEKLTVWVALLASVAAGAGVEALLARRRAGFARWTAVGAVTALALAAVAALAPASVAVAAGGPFGMGASLAGNLTRGCLHAGALLAVLALVAAAIGRGSLARSAPFVLLAIVAADLFGGNAGAYVLGRPDETERPPLAAAVGAGARVLTPFSLREDRWPQEGRLASTWRWARRTLAASWNVPLRVGSPHDYVGLREARWSRLRGEIQDASSAVVRLGLFGFSHMVVPGDVNLARWAGVAGSVRIAGVDPELPAWIIEIPHRARAYVADEVTAVGPEAAFAFAVSGGAPGTTVIEAALPSGYQPSHGGEARILVDLPGRTEVEARTQRPALLVLNDAWAPGWEASVDGARVEIQRANWVARGVWVPAGTHQIHFRYRTPGLAVGWALALGLGVILALWATASHVRRRGTKPEPT